MNNGETRFCEVFCLSASWKTKKTVLLHGKRFCININTDQPTKVLGGDRGVICSGYLVSNLPP